MATNSTLESIRTDYRAYVRKLRYEPVSDDSVPFDLFDRLATIVEQTCLPTAERDEILADSRLSSQDYADLCGLERAYWGDQLLHLIDRASKLQEKHRLDRQVFVACFAIFFALALLLTLMMR